MKIVDKSHLVILLHGINKTSSCLNALERHLQSKQFSTINITYPSTTYSITDLRDRVHDIINFRDKEYEKVSFVGFSMGGLIIRAYLNKYKISNLKNVIMVGTPNNGSEVVDFIMNNKLFKKLLGPAGMQLSTNQKSLSGLLGKLEYECGIIAGNLPLDLCYPIMRKKPSDGKVSVDSTKLDNMKDHIVLNVPHWFMPQSRSIWKYIVLFLRNSSFN